MLKTKVIRARALFGCSILLLSLDAGLLTSDTYSRYSIGGFLRRLAQECRTWFTGDMSSGYWEADYPARKYERSLYRDMPSSEFHIDFVVPILSCPEDTSDNAGKVDTTYDPGHALYDVAAVLKHSIEANLYNSGGKYTAVMHAIFNPNAIECIDPNGTPYDRIKVMASLGYYVAIQGSAINAGSWAKDKDDAMAQDVGYYDLTRLRIFEHYTANPVIVHADLCTVVNPDVPIEPYFDSFIADASKTIAIDLPGPTVPSLSLIMTKPNPLMFETLKNIYIDSSYSITTGWAGSGRGVGAGGMGTAGLLSYYYTSIKPTEVMDISRCVFSNDHTAPCLQRPTNEIIGAKMCSAEAACGAPWQCPDTSALSVGVQNKCSTWTTLWNVQRADFEDRCWIAPSSDLATRTGLPEKPSFCTCSGDPDCYNRMIMDKPAPISCDAKTYTNSDVGTIHWGNGKFQAQKLALTTGRFTGQDQICVNGYVVKAGFEPPMNLCFVIDVSGSTGATFGGSPTGDVNGDGRFNTILDAEIASTLAVLDYITSSADLGNHNVEIGLVTFSTQATYQGRFQPADPNDSSQVNAALRSTLLGLRSGGYTHFDDALDKSIIYFQGAPPKRSNLLFFLSDGIPNVGGDGDNEPDLASPTNNHPSALMFDSELAALDAMEVYRLAIGVGSGSDVREGYGLWLIDNTPDEDTGERPELVTTSDGLTEALLSNPVVGQPISFDLWVNGVKDNTFGLSDINSGSIGFMYGTLIVSVPYWLYGGPDNVIKVAVVMDYDGNPATTDDQNYLEVENTVKGGLLHGKFIASTTRRRLGGPEYEEMPTIEEEMKERQCYQDDWPFLYEKKVTPIFSTQ